MPAVPRRLLPALVGGLLAAATLAIPTPGAAAVTVPSGYGPADLALAYDLAPAQQAAQGTRRPTVAVVTAFDDPEVASKLASYRQEFRLPGCTAATGCFTEVGQDGTATLPTLTEPSWSATTDEALDMVSAACPRCRLLLVEASDQAAGLFQGVATATTVAITNGFRASVVAMPWGIYQWPGESDYTAAYFARRDVAYVAPAGDDGRPWYPALSPDVVAVGGTTLTQDPQSARGWDETVWNDGDSATSAGCSTYEAKPAWQAATTAGRCTGRTSADLAAVADPATGVAAYTDDGWVVAGGTPIAAALVAGMYGLAGPPNRYNHPSAYPYYNAYDNAQTDPGAFSDVTTGSTVLPGASCPRAGLCIAKVGYDAPTGWGSPYGVDGLRAPPPADLTIAPPAGTGALTGWVGAPVALDVHADPHDSLVTVAYQATGLPPGVVLGPTGSLTGTPSAAGTFRARVTAVSSAGPRASVAFSWTLAPPPRVLGALRSPGVTHRAAEPPRPFPRTRHRGLQRRAPGERRVLVDARPPRPGGRRTRHDRRDADPRRDPALRRTALVPRPGRRPVGPPHGQLPMAAQRRADPGRQVEQLHRREEHALEVAVPDPRPRRTAVVPARDPDQRTNEAEHMRIPALTRKGRYRRLQTVLTALVVLVAPTVVVGFGSAGHAAATSATLPPPPPATTGQRRNIVFVLTDDLSNNLVPYMPHVVGLMARGMTFTNFTVDDSLCCPSRASTLTGQFPHNTGIYSNAGPAGGYGAFVRLGDKTRTFASTLRSVGYRTGFFGKYLNGYVPADDPVGPPGWSTWGGMGNGYAGYNYDMSMNGVVVHHGRRPSDYVNNVVDTAGRQFITSSADSGRPFMLEIATFSPHAPYTPARQDIGDFLGLGVPRTPAIDVQPENAPPWLAARPPRTDALIAHGDYVFERRVESVQSVDRMIGHLERTLRATGQWNNTVFVFSSDNGYHIGEYRLTAGKQTAFDTDVNVPLIVAGPGIAHGAVDPHIVQNIDLAPSFDQLAQAPQPTWIDGRSIVPLLHGRDVPWRTIALVEHHDAAMSPSDPDHQQPAAGAPPFYKALRTGTATYVQYADGEREYYDRSSDRYELHNIYGDLTTDQVQSLDDQVAALADCQAAACWTAGQPSQSG